MSCDHIHPCPPLPPLDPPATVDLTSVRFMLAAQRAGCACVSDWRNDVVQGPSAAIATLANLAWDLVTAAGIIDQQAALIVQSRTAPRLRMVFTALATNRGVHHVAETIDLLDLDRRTHLITWATYRILRVSVHV